jgi:hypothetical protein
MPSPSITAIAKVFRLNHPGGMDGWLADLLIMLSQLTWLYSHSNKLPLRKSCIALPPDTIGKSGRRVDRVLPRGGCGGTITMEPAFNYGKLHLSAQFEGEQPLDFAPDDPDPTHLLREADHMADLHPTE